MTEDEIGPEPQILSFSVLQERRRVRGTCSHRRFEIDSQAGAVYCFDCKEEVSAFEALMIITRQDSLFKAQWKALRREIETLKAYKPWLKAVKHLEGIWRGRSMLPQCPHCRRGVRAEDLASTGCVSHEYEKMMLEQRSRLKLVASKQETSE